MMLSEPGMNLRVRLLRLLRPLSMISRAALAGIALQIFLATPAHSENASDAVPNIILILADDLGWSDIGCDGNTFNETPCLDRLAKEGLRFTQFYAGPVCSPTRANLQSGRDQARFGITQHIPGHRRPFAMLTDPVVAPHLPLQVETFAERLQQAGYATGYFGKWHLGGAEHGPEHQGWQTVLELQGHTVPPRVAEGSTPQRTAQFLTEQAIKFMDRHRQEPFLLQVSHYAVHIPLSATLDRIEKYKRKPPMAGYPSRPEYAALLEELDQSVGQLVDAVDRLGLSNNTLIIFVSDNGGLEHEQNGKIVTSNSPLRGEKGTLYEGGIRVPAIARWPEKIAAGTVCDVPVTTMDLYPTFVELARTQLLDDQRPDGDSLAALLMQAQTTLPRESLYWHLPHYHHSTPAGAIRHGDWKLIEFFEHSRIELYNLRLDPSESVNLADTESERAQRLLLALQHWRRNVDAQMPVPNPNYDPARASELARGAAR